MADILVTNGLVVTMDPARSVIADGAVAVRGTDIVDVGSTDAVTDRHDADRVIDAAGHAVLPGLINTHTHVPDILLRGVGNDRSLFDWLYNIDIPGLAAMTVDDHELAAALYCREALSSGTTTVVENAVSPYGRETVERKFDVYETAGIRNVYARGFREQVSETRERLVAELTHKEPAVEHVETGGQDIDEALAEVADLIETYHGTAGGRQSVWPAPIVARGVSQAGLERTAELAERYDVMATTHVSEVRLQERHPVSSVEYLDAANYLGERTLLGHCVHVSESDVRLLAATGTKVAHNPLSNLALADGIAPVRAMRNYGVTVGLGTDNPSANDTVNLLNDVRFAALLHKGHHEDAGAVTAEAALAMATIDAARAIGRGDDLGSLEPGKRADLFLLDLDHPHLTPRHSIASAVVYQAMGHEVDTVLCNGSVVVEDGEPAIEDAYPDLLDEAAAASAGVIERAGLDGIADREWPTESGSAE